MFIINGELPKNCAECPCSNNFSRRCNVNGVTTQKFSRPDECPILPMRKEDDTNESKEDLERLETLECCKTCVFSKNNKPNPNCSDCKVCKYGSRQMVF